VSSALLGGGAETTAPGAPNNSLMNGALSMSSYDDSPEEPHHDDSSTPVVTPFEPDAGLISVPDGLQRPSTDNLPARLTTGALIEPAATPTPSIPMPVQAPVILTIDPTLLGQQAPPPQRTWSAGQLIAAIMLIGLITVGGAIAGWLYGGRAEPVYAARSEFIYFLEDAVPDGFLREDRRILTQLVTIESAAVLRPIAEQFDTPLTDLRDALNVEVVDLSEVIRLDVRDAEPERALALNMAVLDAYRETAESTRLDDSVVQLTQRRQELLNELALADLEVESIKQAELGDVSLAATEESLSRQLTVESDRVQRLGALADDLLTGPTTVDDAATINAQIANSRATIDSLQQQLLAVRTNRSDLQQRIAVLLAGETAFQAGPLQSQDVVLSVQEDSLTLEIETVAQRLRRLEALRAESLVDTTVAPSSAPITEQVALAEQAVASLEEQILAVREQRAELAQSAATLPSMTRRVSRLEQDLTRVEDELGTENLFDRPVSPIEVLAAPFVLDEPVGNPKLQFAALGFIASVPIALIATALLRFRSGRKK